LMIWHHPNEWFRGVSSPESIDSTLMRSSRSECSEPSARTRCRAEWGPGEQSARGTGKGDRLCWSDHDGGDTGCMCCRRRHKKGTWIGTVQNQSFGWCLTWCFCFILF